MRSLIAFALILSFGNKTLAQCCSANPVAGAENIGVLSKKTLRVLTYYRFSYSDTYFEGSKWAQFNAVKEANYNFLGSIFAYGITSKITVETELGYFINKTQTFNLEPEYTIKGRGFNNTVVSLKFPLYRRKEKEFECTFGLGAKIPFTTKPLIVNGVELPQNFQSSTGAFGSVAQLFLYKGLIEKGLRFFLLHRFEINGANQIGYKYGNAYITSLFISKSINSHWTGLIQIRNENRTKDTRDSELIEFSGNYITYLSPQLNYTIIQKWNVSAFAEFPIYKYYNGIQLGNKYSLSLAIRRDFSL